MFKKITIAATIAATLAVMPSVASAKGSNSHQPAIAAEKISGTYQRGGQGHYQRGGQGHYQHGGPQHQGYLMSSYAIQNSLYRYGFRNVRVVSATGYYAVAYAHGRYGPVKLTVSRKNGYIVNRERLVSSHSYGYRGGSGFGLSFRFGH